MRIVSKWQALNYQIKLLDSQIFEYECFRTISLYDAMRLHSKRKRLKAELIDLELGMSN